LPEPGPDTVMLLDGPPPLTLIRLWACSLTSAPRWIRSLGSFAPAAV
jgi:hypothetical protein